MKYQFMAIVIIMMAALLTPGCTGADKSPAATTTPGEGIQATATPVVADQSIATDQPNVSQSTAPVSVSDTHDGTIATDAANTSTGYMAIDPSLASISGESNDDAPEQGIPTPDPGIID